MLESVQPPRILVGPLLHSEQIGAWIHHPQIRAVRDPKALLRPPGWEALLAYDPDPDCPWIPYDYGESLSTLLQRLGDWEPELILWWGFAYTVIPPGLEAASCPVVLIASDWQSCAHEIWRWRAHFDLILGDQGLIQWLQASGYTHCAWWPGYGFSPRYFKPRPDLPKCWDLTYVGNLNPDTHPERLRWLYRLLPLQKHFRLYFSDRVLGFDYVKVLCQSRLVFNHSLRGEMNLRAFEAPACGALLLQEAENLEISRFLTPGQSCVLYQADTLLSTITELLADPARLARMAQAGLQQIQAFSYERQFTRLLTDLPAWLEQKGRKKPRHRVSLDMRYRQALIPALNSGQAASLQQLGQPETSDSLATLHSRCCVQLTLQQAVSRARKQLHWLLNQAPTHPVLLHNLAWATHMDQQPYTEVLARISTALTQLRKPYLEKIEDHWLAWVLPLTGSAAFRLAWEKGLKEGTGEKLQQLLIWNLLRLQAETCLIQRPDLSVVALEEAVQLPDTPPTLWLPLARLYLHFGWYSQALQALENARTHLPLQRDIWQTALQASLKYRDYGNAWRWLKKALLIASVLPTWQDAYSVWVELAHQLGLQ